MFVVDQLLLLYYIERGVHHLILLYVTQSPIQMNVIML